MTDTSFSGHWQTLTLCFYRFLFITCSLAALGDCGLLALQLLNTFSHIVLRTQCAFILQNDKSVFDIESHTLLLHTTGLEPALHSLSDYCFHLLSQVYAIGRWGMRLNIRTFWVRPIRHRPARSLERTHFSLSHLSFDLRCYFVWWTQHLCLPTLASKSQYRYPRISSLNATPPVHDVYSS